MTTATAIVFEKPEQIALSELPLVEPGDKDVIVDIDWSGISTGTERLLWTGRMPDFPGMGYPLVPGYESVGHVVEAGAESGRRPGDVVFVPGARCYGAVRGLFGGAASRVVTAGPQTVPIDAEIGEKGVLIALAATAQHAIAAGHDYKPDLIVGHGVLGRLMARIATAMTGPPPVVWERNPDRRHGAEGYEVIDPADDSRTDYRAIYDVSGAPDLLDTLVSRMAPGGEIVLAGFYDTPLSFNFPPAFMKEARIRVAAQWSPADLELIVKCVHSGRVSLDGLITHRARPDGIAAADEAYRTAFDDPHCLKMIFDWRGTA